MDESVIIEECIFQLARVAQGFEPEGLVSLMCELAKSPLYRTLDTDTKEEVDRVVDIAVEQESFRLGQLAAVADFRRKKEREDARKR